MIEHTAQVQGDVDNIIQTAICKGESTAFIQDWSMRFLNQNYKPVIQTWLQQQGHVVEEAPRGLLVSWKD